MTTSVVFIPYVHSHVKKSRIVNAFVEMFDDIKVKLEVYKKVNDAGKTFYMMNVNLTTTKKTDMQNFKLFNNRIKNEGEVWVYYHNDYYFKARKVKELKKNKNRMISKGDMDNLKNKKKSEESAESAEEDAAESAEEDAAESAESAEEDAEDAEM